MCQEITEKGAQLIQEAFVMGSSNIKSIEATCRGDSVYMTVDRFLVGITEYKIITEPKENKMSHTDYSEDYINGLKCSHMGNSVEGMTVTELIEFIGQLDTIINKPKEKISISVCTYNDGLFEVMIKDENGHDIILEGNQKINGEQLNFLNEVAPACVFTEYQRIK